MDDDVEMSFSVIDYAVVVGMLLLSVVIGLYFYFCGDKQTPKEYLLGGKSMNVLPVGLSLVATHISGITLLAVPADVYVYGANYIWICVTLIPICIINCYVCLPVLIKLEVPSVFEYLNLRFGKHLRTIASLCFILQVFIYIPIVVFIPAIALAQATGIYVHFITPAIGIICMFYTTIGGFKTVIWTDVFQFVGIIGSVIAIIYLGVSSVGGFEVVWKRAQEGQRLDIFDYTLDPTIRDGVWPIFIGGFIHWLNNICFLQGSVQKYLSVSNLSSARKVTVMVCCGLIGLTTFSVMTGIIVYAKYYLCDPITKNLVKRNDQILPYFVMDVAGDISGLPGIFIAGILSAALSTMSSIFNSTAATIYGDFLSPLLSKEVSEKWSKHILKVIVVSVGTLCIILTLFVDRMGTLLAFANASLGLISGISLGIFTLGMLFPCSNTKGVLWGTIISFTFSLPIVVLNQWYKLQGMVETFEKPLSVTECNTFINSTTATFILKDDEPFILFRLSIWYNPIISFVLLIVFGLIVSRITKDQEQVVDPNLISPIFKIFAKTKQFELNTKL